MRCDAFHRNFNSPSGTIRQWNWNVVATLVSHHRRWMPILFFFTPFACYFCKWHFCFFFQEMEKHHWLLPGHLFCMAKKCWMQILPFKKLIVSHWTVSFVPAALTRNCVKLLFFLRFSTPHINRLGHSFVDQKIWTRKIFCATKLIIDRSSTTTTTKRGVVDTIVSYVSLTTLLCLDGNQHSIEAIAQQIKPN